MFGSDRWKRMRSDRSLELSIFHVDRWMTWRQVKKMSSSSLSISAWSTSHYFFKHCNHDSQYLKRLFYLISFHQLLDDTVDVMKTFRYQRSRRIANSSITCNHNSQTLHLNCLITNSIFSSLTDIDLSLIFFVDRLWLLEEELLHEWKLCMTTFLIMQCSNIVQTASNWDLLTLLTSIQTQNKIKRFVVNIMYRWISLSVKMKQIFRMKSQSKIRKSEWLKHSSEI